MVVQSTSQERADALTHLWTYRDDSFLPHATWRAADVQDQPIVLAVEEGNPNRANVQLPGRQCRSCPRSGEAYDRVVLVFNGDDGEAQRSARRLDRLQVARVRDHIRVIPTSGADGNAGNSKYPAVYMII